MHKFAFARTLSKGQYYKMYTCLNYSKAFMRNLIHKFVQFWISLCLQVLLGGSCYDKIIYHVGRLGLGDGIPLVKVISIYALQV